jgi:hypothetical protein
MFDSSIGCEYQKMHLNLVVYVAGQLLQLFLEWQCQTYFGLSRSLSCG